MAEKVAQRMTGHLCAKAEPLPPIGGGGAIPQLVPLFHYTTNPFLRYSRDPLSPFKWPFK